VKAKHSWKVLAILAAAFVAAGSAHAGVSCHNIHAKGIGQDLGNGSTEARIIGGGLLHGTTLGQFSIDSVIPPVASFHGTVTFTTKHGTAVVAVNGVLDITTGQFSAAGPVSGGTGKLADASGNIALQGTQDLATGAFVEDVSGLLCVDLAP
jgi:hypothetical protein